MKIPITDIKIGNRFRKDLGNLQELADSIEDVGLLQPVVINENNELVDGQRRIEAAKKAGWTEIPVYILNVEDIIKGELHANTVRKDFTTSERAAIFEEIKTKRIGHRPKKDSNLEGFSEQQRGRETADIIAELTNVSRAQVYKEMKIVEAARDKPRRFGKLLESVDKKETSVDAAFRIVRDYIRPVKTITTTTTTITPHTRVYTVILADPPWKYNIETLTSSPNFKYNNHYEPMDYVEIGELSIPTYKDAILFLWAPWPVLEEALYIIEKWGFKYMTNFVWLKDRDDGLLSNYTSDHRTELLFIARKGDVPVPMEHTRPPSVIGLKKVGVDGNNKRLSIASAPIPEDGGRPEVVYETIERMYPNRRYVELFPRRENKRKDWDTWLPRL
jgi:N6-adenosine-specific RNA methylase IME4